MDSLALVNLEKTLQHDNNQILFQEELLWCQKSIEQWVKLGHKNSAFFHAQTIMWRRRNKVHGLGLSNCTGSTNSTILQNKAFGFFKRLFSAGSSVAQEEFHVAHIPQLGEEAK